MLKKFNSLSYTDTPQWRWNYTAEAFTVRPNMRHVIHVPEAQGLVAKGPIKVYCFLITNDTYLEIENCSKKHAYICERSEGNELIYSRTKYFL